MALQVTTGLVVFLLIMLTPWLLTAAAWVRWSRAGRPGHFKIGEALISWLLGMIGGGLCGAATAATLPFFDRQDPSSLESNVYFGAYIGAILGAFVTPFSYPYLIRKIGVRKAFLPAMIGTLIGGFLALSVVRISALFLRGDAPPALFIVPVAIVVLFFFGALRWTVKKETLKPEREP